MSVPLYSSDLALLDVISEKRALRLEDCGLAKVVRHKGHINRVVFYRRPDERGGLQGRLRMDRHRMVDVPDIAERHWHSRRAMGGEYHVRHQAASRPDCKAPPIADIARRKPLWAATVIARVNLGLLTAPTRSCSNAARSLTSWRVEQGGLLVYHHQVCPFQ